MTIYTLRTTSGREDIVIDLLTSRIKAEGINIKSVFHPAEIKGYIFIEGPLGGVHKSILGLMHAKGLIEKPVRLDEISHFLETKKARLKIDIDDTVEIIGGPFKGERGKIKRIDKVKDEITIELLEASIPIPVTIATEFIKIVKKARPEAEPTSEIVLPGKEEEPEEEPTEEKQEKKKFSLGELRKEMGEDEIEEEKAKVEEERTREAIEEEAEEAEKPEISETEEKETGEKKPREGKKKKEN